VVVVVTFVVLFDVDFFFFKSRFKDSVRIIAKLAPEPSDLTFKPTLVVVELLGELVSAGVVLFLGVPKHVSFPQHLMM